MRASTLFLVALCVPVSLLAGRYSNYPNHVVRSFHAGPESVGCEEGYIYVDDNIADHECEGTVQKGSWRYIRTDRCRDAWHVYGAYCPLYDDSDIADEVDSTTKWPSKKESSWMQELTR